MTPLHADGAARLATQARRQAATSVARSAFAYPVAIAIGGYIAELRDDHLTGWLLLTALSAAVAAVRVMLSRNFDRWHERDPARWRSVSLAAGLTNAGMWQVLLLLVALSDARPEVLALGIACHVGFVLGSAITYRSDSRAGAVIIIGLSVPTGAALSMGLLGSFVWPGVLVLATGTYTLFLIRGQAAESAERARIELLLEHKVAQLEQSIEAAEAANQTKSEFLARVSHEIRTPLNGIVGMAELLKTSRLKSQQRENLRTLADSAEALLLIVNDLLDFSRMEAGKLELVPSVFHVAQTVEAVAELLATTADAKHIDLVVFVAPACARDVRGDAGRLRQVLLNLVGNAIKFTEQGEVVIRVTAPRMTAGVLTIRVDVADTGPGIDPQTDVDIFDSFSQADKGVARKFGGTGLGLAIAKRLTVAMDGEIGFESEPGEGSTFWIEVPYPVVGRQRDAIAADIGGRQCLVIDRPGSRRDATVSLLERLGARSVRGAGPSGAASLILEDLSLDLVFVETADALTNVLRHVPDDSNREVRFVVTANAADAATFNELTELANRRVVFMPRPSTESHLRRATRELWDADSGDDSAPSLAAIPTGSAGRQILVAEDNPVNQDVIVQLLEKLGFDPVLVDDGRAAVVAARAGGFAAILMDCHMPVLDGFAAAKAVREAEQPGIRVPIIAVTADATEESFRRAQLSGMNDRITKPIRATLLAEVLERWAGDVARHRVVTPAVSSGELQLDMLDETVLDQLRQVGGRALVERITGKFCELLDEELAAVSAAATAGDEPLAMRAHRLRGSCAMVGAVAMSAMCHELENVARSGRPDDASVKVLLDRLHEFSGITRRALTEAAGRPAE